MQLPQTGHHRDFIEQSARYLGFTLERCKGSDESGAIVALADARRSPSELFEEESA